MVPEKHLVDRSKHSEKLVELSTDCQLKQTETAGQCPCDALAFQPICVPNRLPLPAAAKSRRRPKTFSLQNNQRASKLVCLCHSSESGSQTKPSEGTSLLGVFSKPLPD